MDKQIQEQLMLVLEKKLFIDEMKATDKQFRALEKCIKNSTLITDELSSLQESIQSNLTEIKKILKSKGLL